jgi:hypothetical protein
MRITLVSRGALCVVSFLIALGAPPSSSAQNLLAARAESLNEVFDGMEEISSAVGQNLSRERVLGMGSEIFGSDPSEFLALDRPVAALMPMEGMMLQQKGVVVAVPVTDAAAAIEALASRFPDHAVEGELHTFSTDQGPVLYLTAANGYLKLGGDADLVTRIDPLAAGPTGSTLSVELFVEPIAPMIEANLAMARAQLMSSLETEAAGDAEMRYDPATMGPILDIYFDAFRWLLANTNSVRLRLDVDHGYVRFAKDLIPKPGSGLAGFVEAQKGGLPEIAKLADEESAWYMAGQLTLTDEHRQGLKNFVDGYIDLMSSMFATQAGSADAGAAEATSEPVSAEDKAMAFWNEYMAVISPYASRWIDCLRGDMVASFDFPDGQPFQFFEAFGLVDGDECANLVSEMSDDLINAVGSVEELSDVFTVAKGPEIGNSESLVMTFDMVKMLDEMGQASDEQAEAMMTAMYGERMSGAMVTAGDVVLAAGGTHAVDHLGDMVAMLPAPGKAPSFSPLAVRPGLMMGINIGPMLSWMKTAIPESPSALESAAERLSGGVGRVPMSMSFGTQIATFEIAVSLETVKAIATIVEEERAKTAEAHTMAAETEIVLIDIQ